MDQRVDIPLLKSLPAELKSGMTRDRDHRRQHFCYKNAKWFIIGGALAFILFIAVAGLVVYHYYDHQTYRSLKKCLYDMPVYEAMPYLVVPSGRCNDEDITMLDLKHFTNLRNITIGSECFMYVTKVLIEGLNDLVGIQIGKNSFTHAIDSFGFTSSSFYLRDCPNIYNLEIDSFSFSDYSTCIISNVPSLKKIIMGGILIDSYSFFFASLELKGGLYCIPDYQTCPSF